MTLVEFIVFLPIVSALIILAGAPARATALLSAAFVVAATILTVFSFKQEYSLGGFAFQMTSSHELMPEYGLSLAFGIDGISLVMIILTALVLLAAVWVSPPDREIDKPRLYYASSLFIAGGALGAFCATDLFFFYAFHELALIPTFLMIGLYGHSEPEKRIRTAWTVTIYLGVGSLILLAGLIALYMNSPERTFDIARLVENVSEAPIADGAQNWIFLTLLIGFGILVSLFPFHTWAAPAYAEAPTPTAMLHAGVLKKFGLYGLIRVAMPLLPAGAEHWMNLLLVLLLGNIIFVGLVTIAQKDLARMLGNSSVMHMGYVFLGIASMNTLGTNGAVLLMFAHGISIALLFALAGKLRHFTPDGSLEFKHLGGGLAKIVPSMGLLFGFATFASIGLPGFGNFAAEVMVFFGTFKEYADNPGGSLSMLQWAGIIALWGVVISAVYGLRAYRNIFMGPRDPAIAAPTTGDLNWADKWPIVMLIAALLLVGFMPDLLLKYVAPVSEAFAPAAEIATQSPGN